MYLLLTKNLTIWWLNYNIIIHTKLKIKQAQISQNQRHWISNQPKIKPESFYRVKQWQWLLKNEQNQPLQQYQKNEFLATTLALLSPPHKNQQRQTFLFPKEKKTVLLKKISFIRIKEREKEKREKERNISFSTWERRIVKSPERRTRKRNCGFRIQDGWFRHPPADFGSHQLPVQLRDLFFFRKIEWLKWRERERWKREERSE